MTDMLSPTIGAALRVADQIDGPLRCTAAEQITHDVKSFSFESPDGVRLAFRPGQYLTFSFDIDDEAVERCYSLSSAPPDADPTGPGSVTITVKRKPGGTVSNWLHDELRVGDVVRATGPFGRFGYAFHPAERYLFLTAGSGITPVMSMVRTLCATAAGNDIVLVHTAHAPGDIIFRAELEALARDGVRVAVACTHDASDEVWTGQRGRLGMPRLLAAAPDLLNREIFCCGPEGFMQSVREMLGLLQTDPDHHHEESFALSTPLSAPSAESNAPRFSVTFQKSGRVVDCDASTTVLAAAARDGLSLPCSCCEGMCGTCKTQLVSGTVDMNHAGGIRKREIDQGKVLLCCSTPKDDLVVDA